MGAGKAPGRAAVVAALFLGGCSGGREVKEGWHGEERKPFAGEPLAPPGEVRREFVVMRELVKQHALQSKTGRAERVETVEQHLRERLENLSDDGSCEEERTIAFQARELIAKMEEQAP